MFKCFQQNHIRFKDIKSLHNGLKSYDRNRSIMNWFKGNKEPTNEVKKEPPKTAPPHVKHGKPPNKIPGIQHILAVASGKGGVGKSTVSVNLALALSQKGKRVGLLDADIYGPSIPTLMNIHDKPLVNEKKFMIPLTNYGIKCMSMGFIIPPDNAAIWRGPIVMGALEQLLYQVEWGELDILVVDLPPGTGDVQLSLTQRTPLSGAVIVSTPQKVALDDVIRGIQMFGKVNVPILGIVENMSYFQCKCGEISHIFDTGGAKKLATEKNVDVLQELPLDPKIRESSDAGKPIVVFNPQSTSAQKYKDIADKVILKLESKKGEDEFPEIVIE